MKLLRQVKFGEAFLWLGFVFFAVSTLDGNMDEAAMMAGLCALAAIGVRATRPINVGPAREDA